MSELNLHDMEQATGGKGANQHIKATGDVYVRKSPNLDGAEMGIIKNGGTAPFLGEIRVDNRGVGWYKILFNGKTGWVSSKFSKFV